MSDIATMGGVPASSISALSAQTDKLLKNPGSADKEDSKIEKAAKDFESILLGSWLQQAEKSFATVPGGDEDEDADPGKEQMEGIAMQSLGNAMAESGGIGIAKMIARNLHKSAETEK